MKRKALNSPHLSKLKKRRKKVFLNKIFLFFSVLLVIFAVLAYISHASSLNVDEIQITGNKVVETQMIEEAVRRITSGKHLWLFPKTNILLYPKGEIKNTLNNQFPRIRDVEFSIQSVGDLPTGQAGKKILEVLVTEREALYIWCGDTLPEPVDAKCYFVDKDGYIFAESPYFSGEVYFRFYGLPTGQAGLPTGQAGLPEQNGKTLPDFEKLIFFKETLENMALKPVILHTQENGDINIFLSAGNTFPGPKIIFKMNSDFLKVAENLEAALGTEPLLSNFKNKYSSLEYIDLRFGNKVVYRFR